ncbi:protein SAR DEFICIENT 1-like [Zingiber officinale]|uniref:protein SAR DEFICIENT 1-like n=1 Tax=Zingiber officinale TaxID=94328 RepID=UPI001C4D130F|nr:protein SAR DEFICIENT 1-like [Zingiber officinale]
MATKRLRQDADQDPELSDCKQMRRLPSFPTVIREAVMANSLKNILVSLEPMLRKMVQEEVERGVSQSISSFERSNSIHIEPASESSSLKLVFQNHLSLPIFTGSKIEGTDSKPLQLAIVDACTGEPPVSPLMSTVKVEVVVLDGDFPGRDQPKWSSSEFQNNIVRERTGKRPLLAGDVNLTLRDGSIAIPDLSFTDNSSWIRSRHFRIGARVVAGSHEGPKIKEAMTVPFMVKDHRGELYRKHYPPALGDEVWRLEKIAKDGAFHRKLSDAKIYTVQDFLKLLAVDAQSLRTILGMGMSDRVWEATLAHAKTCNVGETLYLYRGTQCRLLLNPVCELVEVVYDGITLSLQNLSNPQRTYVQHLVREAYQNWDKVEETNALVDHNILRPNEDCQLEDYEILDPSLSYLVETKQTSTSSTMGNMFY